MRGGGQQERKKRKKSLKSLVVCSDWNGGKDEEEVVKTANLLPRYIERSNVDNNTHSILKSHLFSVVVQLEKL